jgi:hypothetical protein
VKLATKDLIEDDLEEDHQRSAPPPPSLLLLAHYCSFAIKVLKKMPQGHASSGQLNFRNSRKESSGALPLSPIPADPATVSLSLLILIS